MNLHLSLAGHWTLCRASSRPCPRVLHLQDVPLAEARLMPEHILWTLAESVDPPHHVDKSGNKIWQEDGKIHRDHDLPAVIATDGSAFWYRNGLKHRDGDKPAVIRSNGDRIWRVKDTTHRVNGPAAIWANGEELWFWQGENVTWREHRRLMNEAMHA